MRPDGYCKGTTNSIYLQRADYKIAGRYSAHRASHDVTTQLLVEGCTAIITGLNLRLSFDRFKLRTPRTITDLISGDLLRFLCIYREQNIVGMCDIYILS